MSDIIKLLPDSVANQIAAGEVIQRPASVIKELVENSIDAGSTDIRIIIKDAGRTLIQVVDNGVGMSPTDARMAFERHATSKIREAADLFSLSTMGFRGEALPSICAISQIELKTRTEDNQIGTRLIINGSKVESQEPVACDKGTNLMVKNLFFNVPARRKFLKSDNVEISNILREFERLALVNNGVRLKIDTGNRKIDLKPATFRQRIEDLWKNALDIHLIPIEVNTSLVKISGYISRPEYARRRNPLQFLIVNGRNMRHPYFHKAIVGCYDSLIAPDTQPCYFLKFEVDPETIDVNIHPTKNEIKFEYEQDIWPILQAAVKAALGKFGAVPSIDFDTEMLPLKPLSKGEAPVKPSIEIPENYSPFTGTVFERKSFPGKQSFHQPATDPNWDSLYVEFMKGARGFGDENIIEKPSVFHKGEIDNGPSNLCIQYKEHFIITTSHEGILFIDQRRAHIKILFEEFYSQLRNGEQTSQALMFPDSIELDPTQQNVIEEILPQLNRVGFKLEYDSENKWNITSIPAFITNKDARTIVFQMLEAVNDSDENYGREGYDALNFAKKLAFVTAGSSAINYGKKLSEEEMEHIVSRLFMLPDPSYTPNGNKIFIILDDNYLSNLLK